MDAILALEFLRMTERAALACARLMGRGDEEAAHRLACEAMQAGLESLPVAGRIVIGEGEPEIADILHHGARIGAAKSPKFDLAISALEGAAILATGGPNALSVVAVFPSGRLQRPPTPYMDKIVVGPRARGAIDINRSATENLKAVASALSVHVEDLVVAILERPRHQDLVREVRLAGARIKLIHHGDLSAALAACREDSEVDILLGIGGSREGSLAAAAVRCLGGEMQGWWVSRSPEEERGIAAYRKKGGTEILRSEAFADIDVVFAATGVTTGDFLGGVRFVGDAASTQSVVMHSKSRQVRLIETAHRIDERQRR